MRFSISTAVAALAATASATAIGDIDGKTITARQTTSCRPGFTFCSWGGSCVTNSLFNKIEGLTSTIKSGKTCYSPPSCLTFAKQLNVDPSLVTAIIAKGPSVGQISYFSKEICGTLDKSSLILCTLKQDINLNPGSIPGGIPGGSSNPGGSTNPNGSTNSPPPKLDQAIQNAVKANSQLVQSAANPQVIKDVTQSLQTIFIKSPQDASAIWNANLPFLSCNGLLGSTCDCLHNPQDKTYCKNIIPSNFDSVRNVLSPQTLNGCGLNNGVFQTLNGGQLVAKSIGCVTKKVLGLVNLPLLSGTTCNGA